MRELAWMVEDLHFSVVRHRRIKIINSKQIDFRGFFSNKHILSSKSYNGDDVDWNGIPDQIWVACAIDICLGSIINKNDKTKQKHLKCFFLSMYEKSWKLPATW